MSITLDDDLAAQMRAARDARHLTQAEAAAQLGVSTRTLQNWEGRAGWPRARHRRALLAWFNGDDATATKA